ncbi:MAG TPA: energy transducer TonB [Thermoanaerobaculia bacterium]|nr:energy transducer TonB [Thermoanaerobaculia bacterium]
MTVTVRRRDTRPREAGMRRIRSSFASFGSRPTRRPLGGAFGLTAVLLVLAGAAAEPTRTPTPPPEPSETPSAVPETDCDEVQAPVLIHRVEPKYPEFLESQGIEGTVIAHSAITAEGKIADLEILESPNEILTRLATDAFRQWRYEPARCVESGKAIRVFVTQKATFRSKHAPNR